MASQVDELLAGLAPEVRTISSALREVLRANTTKAAESVYHDTIVYAPDHSPSHFILFIAQQTTYVNVGFFFGAGLVDPHELLEGKGKRMRHVKNRSLEAAAHPGLADLVRAAWRDGPRHYAKIGAGGKTKGQ